MYVVRIQWRLSDLSVAWSVPTLTAVVTLVSDSSAFHSIRLHSTSFRSVLHSAYEILQTAFCSHLHLGSPLLRFSSRRFCRDSNNINKPREMIALDRQRTQQQKPEPPTVAPPGLRVTTRYINFAKRYLLKTGTEVAARDLVVSCSRQRSCFNLWSGAAAGGFVHWVLSVLRLVKLNYIILCFWQPCILELALRASLVIS